MLCQEGVCHCKGAMREKGQAFLFIQEYQLSSELLKTVFGRAFLVDIFTLHWRMS